MLTVSKLKKMKPDTIFASGVGLIEHPWFNQANNIEKDGRSTKVKWVAIRGYMHDWAIYHSMDANINQEPYFNGTEHLNASDDLIARAGAKLHNEETIKKFVPCDDEALKMYRH
jgi:hypothetical protein